MSSWARLADELGLPYTTTDEADALLAQAPRRMVTGCADAAVLLQEDCHPNDDLLKLAQSVPFAELAAHREHYVKVPLGPAVREGRCRPADRYVLKTDRWAWATFDEVPEGTTWFTTNLGVEHPRIRPLPFGLNDHGDGKEVLADLCERPLQKKHLLYVNFQNYTTERAHLKRHYGPAGWATVRPAAGLPVAQFLTEVAAHRFVLCPFGNGPDCYRTYEALHLGAVPVLPDCTFSRHLARLGLPVLLVDDLFGLAPAPLEAAWARLADFSLPDCLTLDYWRKALCTR